MEFHTVDLVKSLYELSQASSQPARLSTELNDERELTAFYHNTHHTRLTPRQSRSVSQTTTSTRPMTIRSHPPTAASVNVRPRRIPTRLHAPTNLTTVNTPTTSYAASFVAPPPTLQTMFNTPSTTKQRRPRVVRSSQMGQWKDLQNTEFLAGNQIRFEGWKQTSEVHAKHCFKQWPRDMPVFKVYEGGLREPVQTQTTSITMDQTSRPFLSKEDLRNLKLHKQQFCITEYQSSIVESTFWKNDAHHDENRSAWMNLTNIVLPGCGWTGTTPISKHRLDDVDELHLFWNTDLSLYLHPRHPTIRDERMYPLSHGQILMCPNVCFYRQPTTATTTVTNATTATTTAPVTKRFHVLNVALDATEWGPSPSTTLLRMFQKISDLCQMTQLQHIVIPIGRLLRMGIPIQEIGKSICDVFLPGLRNRSFQKIEILVPQNNQSPTFGDCLNDIVRSYIQNE